MVIAESRGGVLLVWKEVSACVCVKIVLFGTGPSQGLAVLYWLPFL